MATLWSCRQIEKIIVSPYSAEKIKKNKLHFCILLKSHEISIISCRRFDLAVKMKKYLCHRFVLKKPWKINLIFVSFQEFSECKFCDGGSFILPPNRKIFVWPYTAEKITKNKAHFCIPFTKLFIFKIWEKFRQVLLPAAKAKAEFLCVWKEPWKN